MRRHPSKTGKVVNLKDYAEIKENLDVFIQSVECYEDSFQTGEKLTEHRRILASVIIFHCKKKPIFQQYLNLSHAQLADIADDGELPPSVVRAFKERLLSVRRQLSSMF